MSYQVYKGMRISGVSHSSRNARTTANAAFAASGHKINALKNTQVHNDDAHRLFDELCLANTFQVGRGILMSLSTFFL